MATGIKYRLAFRALQHFGTNTQDYLQKNAPACVGDLGIHTLCFEGQRDRNTDPGGDGGRALVAITRRSAPVASDYVNPVSYILARRAA